MVNSFLMKKEVSPRLAHALFVAGRDEGWCWNNSAPSHGNRKQALGDIPLAMLG